MFTVNRLNAMKWKNLASETNTYFITATTTEWKPILMYDRPREILLDDMNFYRNKYGCHIQAYVIMLEHYHLIVNFAEPEHLHGWLRDFQSHTSNELAKWIKETVVNTELSVFVKHANGKSELCVWKEQARALGITTTATLRTKVDYIHSNPVKRGLVNQSQDWLWSSWRNYYMDDDSIFRIDKLEAL
jgi:putative transposase